MQINGKVVLRFMNKLSLHSLARRCKVYRALAAVQTEHTYPNRLAQVFHATSPNQK